MEGVGCRVDQFGPEAGSSFFLEAGPSFPAMQKADVERRLLLKKCKSPSKRGDGRRADAMPTQPRCALPVPTLRREEGTRLHTGEHRKKRIGTTVPC